VDETFIFRQGRSRETAFSMDYDFIYELLRYEREHGHIAWVIGPACAFDADAREAFAGLIRHGYVHSLLAGNALAVHDLEAARFRTALGQDIYTREIRRQGHYLHLDTINQVRGAGSIAHFITQASIDNGILYECIRGQVPVVLVGSVRDDGPLPEVYTDVSWGRTPCAPAPARQQPSSAWLPLCTPLPPQHDAILPSPAGRHTSRNLFLYRRHLRIYRQ
jgi:hypothetical protein